MLMPSAWVMNSYQNVLTHGLGLELTWLPALVLLAFAPGFFALIVWRFK
jgi:hypothetical protein